MKTTLFFVVGLLVTNVAWAQIPESSDVSEPRAMDSETPEPGPVLVPVRYGSYIGHRAARQIWDRGEYACTTYEDVITEFYPVVQEQVETDLCERLYSSNRDTQEDCAAGAMALVREKIESCTSLPGDCHGIGDFAGEYVAELYCLELWYLPTFPTPNQCRLLATRRCQEEALAMIADWIAIGECPLHEELTETDVLWVKGACLDEVDRLGAVEL